MEACDLGAVMERPGERLQAATNLQVTNSLVVGRPLRAIPVERIARLGGGSGRSRHHAQADGREGDQDDAKDAAHAVTSLCW
jgi:hypothetical protein